jgi:two-component sensor histidine kinase
MGLELVNTLVGQLKGNIEQVDVKGKGGTEFKITFGV